MFSDYSDDWWALQTPLDDETELAWQAGALCTQTDPEAFFPEKGGSTRAAKRICASCEVRAQCLEYALAREERFGVWGGLSERERRRLIAGARWQGHGTRSMYTRGCHDPETCPGGADGMTCSDANREYDRVRNGRPTQGSAA